jgi:hypothetical protein
LYSVSITGSTWGSQQSPIAVEPGTSNNPFTLYLTNFGVISVLNLSITLNLAYPFSSSSSPNEISNNISQLPPTVTLPSTFYLNIASNSAVGVYPINVTMKYYQGNSNQTVYVPVTTFANLTVQNVFWGSATSPISVSPGTDYAPLVLSVKNAGDNDAYNASVMIHVSKPFQYYATNFQTEETTQLGVIPAGSVVPALFTLSVDSNISTGEYPLNVTLNYNNGIVVDQTIYVPVTESPNIVVQSYTIQEGNVFPGDDNVGLSIYLVNSGNSTADNVLAELSIPSPLSPSYPGSNQMTIGEMPPLGPVSVNFFFNVPSSMSSPKDFEFPLNITYGSHKFIYYIPLKISSISNFTESVNNMPLLEQGSSSAQISLSITNIGNTTAKFVEAQLLLPNELSGTTFTYLGDLDSQTSNIASFAIDVSSSSTPSNYLTTLKITWLQDNAPGKQFSQEIPIVLQVHQSLYSEMVNSLSGINLLYIVVIAVVVIVLIIIVLRRRK